MEAHEHDHVSMEEVEAEDAVSLPNKEVMSLLDVNANVDLGLDLAAPVDLAAAANLNVAAPIEAAASANVLSPGSEALGIAHQQGSIEQGISGSATADAPQHASVAQDSGTASAAGGAAHPATAGDGSGTAGSAHPATPVDAGSNPAQPGSGAASDAVQGATANPAGTVADAAPAATSGGTDALLNGGSLLDANVNIHAAANLAAPVDGAVAANGNVAAPVDAAVAANVGSPGSISEAAAPQEVDIAQNLDHVSADATATQDASVSQK